jgi:hypothetical protein
MFLNWYNTIKENVKNISAGGVAQAVSTPA